MSTQSFTGGCHCGKIRYQVETDTTKGSGRCNCSYCSKTRYWGILVKPSAFKITAGNQSDMGDYQFNTFTGHHMFCKNCGVATHGTGHLEILGGDYVSVNLATLDNIETLPFVNAPIRYSNGLNNDWMNEPSEKRHL